MSKTAFAKVGTCIAISLALVGLSGLPGFMVGQFWLSAIGLGLILISLPLLSFFDWIIRTENNPEYEIKAEWDDETADYIYSYTYYGREIGSGGEKWAKKIAQHYNITMPKEL